jgi:hypothetical protein
MEFLGQSLIVFGILIAVAIAVVAFEPASPFAKWVELAKRYATNERPDATQFRGQTILFGGTRGNLKALDENLRFDIATDDFGLWLTANGADPKQIERPVVRIPGSHVRFHKQRGDEFTFDLFAEPPVRIALHGEAGQTVRTLCEGNEQA